MFMLCSLGEKTRFSVQFRRLVAVAHGGLQLWDFRSLLEDADPLIVRTVPVDSKTDAAKDLADQLTVTIPRQVDFERSYVVAPLLLTRLRILLLLVVQCVLVLTIIEGLGSS